MSRNVKIGDLIQVDKDKADKDYYPPGFDFTKSYEVINIESKDKYIILVNGKKYTVYPREIVDKFLKRILTYE